MGKPVAVEGDAKATASSSPAPADQPAWQGSWSAGTPEARAYAHLSVQGRAVIHEVRCTFSFSGVDTAVSPTPPPVSSSSEVVLSAGSTTLQKGLQRVLLDGDSASDTHGNRLAIEAGGHLRSDLSS
jgi:hypothetical protein